jgi:CCR4-NOT transcription complex subunit 1
MRLFNDWCHTCDHPSSADVAYGRFVMHLQQIGVLMGDDITERFFHIFTELAVKHSLVPNQIVATGGVSQKSSQQLKISYFPIDSFSKLVAMVLKVFLSTLIAYSFEFFLETQWVITCWLGYATAM